MTEKVEEARDVFFRQGILGEGKVPIIMSAGKPKSLAFLNEHTGADVFLAPTEWYSHSFDLLPKATTVQDFEKMPFAIQYMNCDRDLKQICKQHEFMGQCW